jgi:hypothetical protein
VKEIPGVHYGLAAPRPSDLIVSEPDAPDLVNHPPHYTNGPKCRGCGRTIECIDITRWLPFNPGNSIKYLWRRYFGGKVGEDSVEPVEKARWYLDDEVARLKLEAQS